MQLTEKQIKFVDIYARSGKRNAAKAAREAGFANGTAKSSANRLLQQPAIIAAIEAAEATVKDEMDRLETSGWDADRVKSEAVKLFEKGKLEDAPMAQMTKLLEVIGRHGTVGAFEVIDKTPPGQLSLKERILLGRARVGDMDPADEDALAVARAKRAPIFTDPTPEDDTPHD